MTTSFTNAAGDGTVAADGFSTTGSAASAFSNVSGLSGQVQTLTAAGATQGAATAITKMLAIIVVSTASARGAKLPAVTTGAMQWVISLCTQGTKIYPFAGDKIASAATNVAVVLAGFKANLYVGKDTVTWGVLKGA